MNLRPIMAEGPWGEIYRTAHEKLVARLAHHSIEHDVYYPLDDIVVVYRLPTNQDMTKTPGGLWIPDIAQDRAQPYSVGLLLYAGVAALDDLADSGCVPGDYVKFGRFAGDEEAVQRVNDAMEKGVAMSRKPEDVRLVEEKALALKDAELKKQKLLELQAKDLHCSIDLMDRLYGEKPTMEVVRAIEGGLLKHVIRPIGGGK